MLHSVVSPARLNAIPVDASDRRQDEALLDVIADAIASGHTVSIEDRLALAIDERDSARRHLATLEERLTDHERRRDRLTGLVGCLESLGDAGEALVHAAWNDDAEATTRLVGRIRSHLGLAVFEVRSAIIRTACTDFTT